jgi:VIT1/CCC1 family predicted Fe2+/Mn2+ transporter
LALIYDARGLSQKEAHKLARKIFEDPDLALESMVREELNVNPDELGGSAWEAAITSFILFAIGAIIPVISFTFLSGTPAIIGSLVVSAVGLFIIGTGITLFTGRSILFSGSRQVLFGLVAAGITFGIGRLIGVNIGG